MRKHLLILVMVILLMMACSRVEEGALAIRGTITSVSADGDALWILVEGEIYEDTQYDAASITIDDKTKIVDEAGKALMKDAIKEGQFVEIWFMGPVAESYPVQAKASKIIVMEELEAIAVSRIELKDEASLNFTPVISRELENKEPKEGLSYIETIETDGVNGAYAIHLYNDLDMHDNLIYAYIEYYGVTYELGEVSAYGIEDIKVSLMDVTMDGKMEVIISGDMGATYRKTLAIGRDQEDNLILLLEGPFEAIDLDEDGIEEWAAVSMGSLPPYMDIYRWNGRGFEMASIMEALGTNFAYYYLENNEYIIESGIYSPDEETVVATYKYSSGRLIRID